MKSLSSRMTKKTKPESGKKLRQSALGECLPCHISLLPTMCITLGTLSAPVSP